MPHVTQALDRGLRFTEFFFFCFSRGDCLPAPACISPSARDYVPTFSIGIARLSGVKTRATGRYQMLFDLKKW